MAKSLEYSGKDQNKIKKSNKENNARFDTSQQDRKIAKNRQTKPAELKKQRE
jgi:hypothetical protein